MAFPIGSNSLYACFLYPEHGTGPLHKVVLIAYFKRGTMDRTQVVKDSRHSGCPGKSSGRIYRSIYNIRNDSSLERPQFAAKSLLIIKLLRKVMLCIYRVAHEKSARRLVDQRGRRSRTLYRKLNKCKCKVLTG